jgi:hypothetical protein
MLTEPLPRESNLWCSPVSIAMDFASASSAALTDRFGRKFVFYVTPLVYVAGAPTMVTSRPSRIHVTPSAITMSI